MRDKEKYNEYQKHYQLKRYHARRAKAVTQLGGRCTVCESTEELEIDHIDPEQKSFDIGKLWSVAEVRFLNELSKCQLLCKQHHETKSWNEELTKSFSCCGRIFVGKPTYNGHRRWCRN